MLKQSAFVQPRITAARSKLALIASTYGGVDINLFIQQQRQQ